MKPEKTSEKPAKAARPVTSLAPETPPQDLINHTENIEERAGAITSFLTEILDKQAARKHSGINE